MAEQEVIASEKPKLTPDQMIVHAALTPLSVHFLASIMVQDKMRILD